MRLRRPIAFILSAAVAASALTGCDSFSGHAAAAANSAQVQQLIEFIADLGLERDLRQALQSGGDLRQALLTLLGLENAVNFNVDDLAGARPGQHAVQVWEVTAQSAEDAAALAASQIRAVLEQLKSNGVTEGRIGMVEVDGKYYVVVDVEVTEENTFEPVKPVSDDDDDNEDTPSVPAPTVTMNDGMTIDLSELDGSEITADDILKLAKERTGTQYDCYDIIELDLSNCTGITNISGFDFCANLKAVILPEGLQSIGENAFQYCVSLEIVILPSTVATIGQQAFYGCTSLKEINLSDCTNLESIGSEAFLSCWNLAEIDLSSCTNLQKVDDSVFNGCGGLKNVKMGDVGTIGDSSFYMCGKLETVTMGNVGSIGNHAFDELYGLHTVIMGEVGIINGGAFSACFSLTNICFSNSTPPTVTGNPFSYAGSSEGVNIYSNIENENDKETVEGWFDQGVTVNFKSYDKWDPSLLNLPTLPSLF